MDDLPQSFLADLAKALAGTCGPPSVEIAALATDEGRLKIAEQRGRHAVYEIIVKASLRKSK